MLDLREEYITNNTLKEETICNFTVSSEMKTFWAAEQKVLTQIIRICEKYNITYYAAYGTLLGTIRHEGFIPWDDDIDIFLKRNDYIKLLHVLPKELPSYYNIYNCYNNINNRLFWTVVSNYNTLPIPQNIQNQFFSCPYMASIDIFVLDYLPKDPELANLSINIYNILYDVAQRFHQYEKNGELENYIQPIETLCNTTLIRDETLRQQLFILTDKMSALFTEQESDVLINLPDIVSIDRNLRYDKNLFSKVIKKDFNGMKINVPIGYDEILKKYYGNYLLPSNKGRQHQYPVYAKQKSYLKNIIKS